MTSIRNAVAGGVVGGGVVLGTVALILLVLFPILVGLAWFADVLGFRPTVVLLLVWIAVFAGGGD